MKNCSMKLVKHFLYGSVLFAVLTTAPWIYASGRTMNFDVVEQEDRISLVFLFEQRPEIGLKSFMGDRISLTLYDTSILPVIEKKVTDIRSIELDNDSESSDLKLLINPVKPYRKIDCSWDPGKKLFFLGIILNKNKDSLKEQSPRKVVIRDIRFGSKDSITRMVLGLDQRPIWDMTYKDPSTVSMKLDALSKTLDSRRYGPIDLLKDMTLEKSDDYKTLMDLHFESHVNHVSIFWIEEDNRLVMDLQQDPAKMDDKTLLLIADFNTPEDRVFVKEETKEIVPETETINQIPAGRQEKTNQNVTERVVRRKIPNTDVDPNMEKMVETEQTSREKNKFFAEPRLYETFSGNTLSLKSVEDMNPTEAFLFGRIQQALEISDYQKGVLLIDQYLNEFPESPLIERLLFLRGDLYYGLSRKNDEISSKLAIQSYLYAMDRFGRSEHVPLANIKVSQLESELDKNYKAIGRLSMVINIGEKEYIPLAYISRGRIYLKLEQYERAVEDFKVLLNAFPNSIYAGEARFWIANYYHIMGLYEEAEKRLDEISDSNPDFYLEYPEFLSLKAQNYIYLKKYAQARDNLFTALNLGNQYETADLLLSRIGDTYHHQDRKKDAEKFYRMVLDYYPKTEGASIAKLRLADYLEDITILEGIADNKNDESISELALLEKAYQLYDKKQYQYVMENLSELIGKPVQTETRKEARRLFHQAAERGINHLYQEGRFNELVELYSSEKMRLTGKLGPDALFLIGSAFNMLNRPDEAIPVLSQVKPYDFEGKSRGKYYMELANSYIASGEDDKAQKFLEARDRNNMDTFEGQRMSLMLADIYRSKDMIDKAYPIYESIVRNPKGLDKMDEARAYLELGKIFYKKRDYERAKISLNRCIDIAEKIKSRGEILQQAHMEAGRVLYGEQKYKQAVVSFERGFSLGYAPEREDYWERRFQLALAYMGTGEDSKAVPLLSEISDEGDAILQQKAQLRLGSIGLTRELRRLSLNP